MKTTIVLMLLFNLWTLCASGQIYSFSTSNRIYTALEDPISLNNGIPWVSPDYIIPIGFDFNFFSSTIDTLFFVPDQGGSLLSSSNAEDGIHQLINPFGAVLIDRGFTTPNSLSPISYQLTGDAPSRILKVEWGNCGFYYDLEDDGESSDYINFQLWLYESNGTIEIHYGPHKITQLYLAYNFEPGPQVNLIPAYYVEQDSISTLSLWLYGVATNPNMVTSGFPFFLEGNIPVNKVFRFKNIYSKVGELDESTISINPNPCSDYFFIEKQNGLHSKLDVFIYNAAGVLVYKKSIGPNNAKVDFTSFKPGVYMVEIRNKEATSRKKIIKI